MCRIPPIDWNGNGRIDPADIAVFLAMNEAGFEDEDEDGPDVEA